MKKLYIGLGISVALIIGGFSYSAYSNPKVDMTKMGKYYYQLEQPKGYNKYDINVISASITDFKARVEIKDFSGAIDLGNLITSILNEKSESNTLSKMDKKLLDINNITAEELGKAFNPNWKEGDKVPDRQEETITYKWIDEPRNLIFSTREYDNPKNKKVKDMAYMIQKPLLVNGNIPESGSMETYKYGSGDKVLRLHGVRGSGVLEVERKIVYK